MDCVFLHGINNTGRSFDKLQAELPPDWHVLAPDLPALSRVEDIVADLLPRLPDRFMLLGHSFGGYVALALLQAAPDRILGLVLVNSAEGADSPAAAKVREERACSAEAGGYERIASGATSLSYHPDSLGRADLMAERAQEVMAYGAARFAAHSRACAARPDRGDTVAAWQGPKLVIAARNDAVIPPDRQRDTARRIGAQLVMIDRAGHMAPAEAPGPIAAAILDLAKGFPSDIHSQVNP